ncbi:anti-sigma factor [Aquimarina sp. U1-2]|uniref:anti-sigma factor n=1 Tax=Aquimarina sp. U1-2 TaxID=2823141 RepID=UPI001AEC9107|nr:anti-sigma factor [Aquimarina sp. U1-2]MBP2833408.1 anti-sigma factor [Aquimarina sp. U1-2]
MDSHRKDDMIDRKSIKEKGILEQYLLGELLDDEQAQVDKILREDKKLFQYYTEIEEGFEKLAFENAIDPPVSIKESVLNAIRPITSDKKEKMIYSDHSNKRFIYWSIAASLAILFMLSSGWLYDQWQSSKNKLQIVQNETLNLRNRIEILEKDLKETNAWYTKINHPNTLKLVLRGNEISPNSTAITYINHKTETVLLHSEGLQKLARNKTYQMWADVDGEMIDMGVIPAEQQMIAMKYIANAASINITIEPAGGSDHPTVERLISNVLL